MVNQPERVGQCVRGGEESLYCYLFANKGNFGIMYGVLRDDIEDA
jgi:hypothetical protein